MRFLAVDDQNIGFDDIDEALQDADGEYHVAVADAGAESEEERAELLYGSDVLAGLEIVRRGSEAMEEMAEELLERVGDEAEEEHETIHDVLDRCTFAVTVNVLRQGRGEEEMLERLAPLWRWLFAEHDGLLQADGEGFFGSHD